MTDTKTTWEVIVGNVGRVYDGECEADARAVYQEYIKQSKVGYGRAGGESVTLMTRTQVASMTYPEIVEIEAEFERSFDYIDDEMTAQQIDEAEDEL